MIAPQIFGLGAAFVVALFYFGYGLARALLPASFAPYRILLTPFVGMALVIVWDYLALFFGFDLTRATWALAAVTTLLNGLALARQGRAQKIGAPRWMPSRAQWLVLALAFSAFLAAIAPLLRYGYVSVIGENWDYEFYLPLADYLRGMPTAALPSAPPNPLLTTILSRHIFPLPMGFSYLHATLDVLTGQHALDSFAVLLGALRGLGTLAAYLFFRATFRMSERAAALATALVAFNGLLLWFTYWSFGLHLAALALAPIALLFGAHALTTQAERGQSALAAGFFLGALNVTYHPALVAVGLPLCAIGGHQLVMRKNRVEIILRGASIVALALLFSFPTLFHIQDFIREYYGRAPLAIGLREFTPLSDGYGFSLYLVNLAVGHTIPTPWLYELVARVWDLGAPLLTLAALAASLYALWRLRVDKERRALVYLVVGASVFYIALFRLPFLRPYPYGFLKSLSLVAYILLALAAQGVDLGIGEWRAERGNWNLKFGIQNLKLRPLLALLALSGFACFTLLTFALSVEQYFKPRPAFFDADALTLRQAPLYAPRGAEIFLTDRAEAQGIPMGLAAYALLQTPLRGNVTTAYGALNNAEWGRVYDYALLARGQEPTLRGYQENALWANETFALYARRRNTLVQTALNHWQDTALPYEITVDENGAPQKARDLTAAPVERALALSFLTWTPRALKIRVGAQETTVNLAPGVNEYTLPRVRLPTSVVVTPEQASALWVLGLQLRAADSGAPELEHSAALGIDCRGAKNTLSARCKVANPEQRVLTWKWIVRGTLAGTRAERVLAEGQATGAPRETVQFQVGAQGNLQAIQFDGTTAKSFDNAQLPSGKGRAAVEVWDENILLARFETHPQIEIDGPRIRWRENTEIEPAILPP